MTVFMPIANLINLIIENWIISVAVFAVFASVCLGLFKGAKYGIWAMSVLLAIAILGLVAFLVFYFFGNSLESLIGFGIEWLPTIIFLITIILSTLIGIRRGLRKSLILMLHSVLMAGICLGLFFFCVTSPIADKLLLNLINTFLGSGGLQNQLGVRSDCETLREVLMELFSSYAVEWGELGILLGASSAYVLTLVNMVYRIVFAIVFFLIYELLLFIMYLIYLIFYSERKYKKKRSINFANNKADSSYNKRPVGGGCVGLIRGLIAGMISLSFVGSMFFIATGGTGASKLPENFSFGEDYDSYISIYRSIERYGDKGIFKILNAIGDPEDTPYYLFAADIVFSGGLDDEEHDVKGNIKFREELAAYTGFAKNTLALLMKYDNDGKISATLRGEEDGDPMDKVLSIFTKPEFKVEFDNLIDNFDAKTYIINFALSLADAVIANIDDVSFASSISSDNKELLQVLFKRGHLSEAIPDERERKHSESAEATEDIPPYITINHLFTKRDAQIVLDIVLSIISNDIDVDSPQSIAHVLLPDLEELSILSGKRSHEMDPVFGRLYCFLENTYLTDEGEDGITYAEIKEESVHWTSEIRALIGVADGLLSLYDILENDSNENIFTALSSMFDENGLDYEEKVRTYEELVNIISDSKVISRVLCSPMIHDLLDGQLKNINKNAYYPSKISYANKYDDEGNLIAHGEAYYTLRGLRFLVDSENSELVDMLTKSSTSFGDLLKKLADTITKDDPHAPGNSLASYLTESTLLRSVISAIIMENAGDSIIVPVSSRETYGEQVVNIIDKTELRTILEAMPQLIDIILPLVSEEININDIIKNLVGQKEIVGESSILTASIVNFIVSDEDFGSSIGIPQLYIDAGTSNNLTNQFETNVWRSELPNLIGAIDEIFEISNNADGGTIEFDADTILEKTKEMFRSLNNSAVSMPENSGFTRLDVCYASEIMRIKITEELDDAFDSSLIDSEVRDSFKIESIYPKDEIIALKDALEELGLDDFEDFDGYDFTESIRTLNQPSKTESGMIKLNKIYLSGITAGVLTKAVRDSFTKSNLIYHPNAERSDIAILKEQELDALVSLVGADLDDFDVGALSLSRIRTHLAPDNEGNPRSYLISANFTDTVISNRSLYVPSIVYQNTLITATEAVRFIDAICALQGDSETLDGWKVDSDMILPEKADRDKILESQIMLATFSHTVFTANSNLAFTQNSINAESYRVIKNSTQQQQIAIISASQLGILFDIIESCTTGNELKIPAFTNINSIRPLADNLDLLCSFDATRYSISSVILSEIPFVSAQQEPWYVFTSNGNFTINYVKVLTTENILNIIN